MSGPVEAIVVSYRSGAGLRRCVDHLLAAGVERVVVVDHAGEDLSGLLPETNVVVVAQPNLGFGAGVNRGVRETTSPAVLVVNPDAAVTPEVVARGTAVLAGRPDAGAVQGVIRNEATGAPERSAGVLLGPAHLLGRALGLRRLLRLPIARRVAGKVPLLRDHAERVPEGPADVEWLAATAVLVRRSAFDAVGGFDESYFLYGEDLDLAHRLRRAGWRLVAVPDRWAVHVSGGSASSPFDRELHWWRGTMRFAAQWWAPARWLPAVAAALLTWVRLALQRPGRAGEAFRELALGPLGDRRRLRRSRASAPAPPSPTPPSSRRP